MALTFTHRRARERIEQRRLQRVVVAAAPAARDDVRSRLATRSEIHISRVIPKKLHTPPIRPSRRGV